MQSTSTEFMTWNLKGSAELLKRALRWVTDGPPRVAALQELPGHLDDAHLGFLGFAGRVRIHAELHHGNYRRHLAIVSSTTFRVF